MSSGFPYNGLDGNEALEAHKRLRRIIDQSGLLRSMATASALTRIDRQSLSGALAPLIERLQEQRAAMAPLLESKARLDEVFAPLVERLAEQRSAMAPLLESKTRLEQVFAPLTEQIAGLQLDVASSLNVAVLASAQWQGNVAKLALGREVGEALQRITDLASIKLAMPTSDGVTRLAELIDAGEFDNDLLDEAEESLAGDVELSEAIDQAADALAAARPYLSRDRARQIVVFWVWLMYGAGLWAVAVFGSPALVAVPAALGAPAAPQAARAVADRLVPRDDEN